MKEQFKLITIALLLLGAATTIGVAASAGIFDLTRSVLVSGSRTSGANYRLDSAIGQPVVGPATGGDFELNAGFLASTDEADAAARQWKPYN